MAGPERSSLRNAGAQHLLGFLHSPWNQHSRAAVRIPLRSFGVAQVASRAVNFGAVCRAGVYKSSLGSGQALPNLGIMELRGSVGEQLKDV